jgi:hypothetical protein
MSDLTDNERAYAYVERITKLREKRKEYNKRYASKPESKAKKREYQKKYLARPGVREKRKEYFKRYNARPENKERKERWLLAYLLKKYGNEGGGQ